MILKTWFRIILGTSVWRGKTSTIYWLEYFKNNDILLYTANKINIMRQVSDNLFFLVIELQGQNALNCICFAVAVVETCQKNPVIKVIVHDSERYLVKQYNCLCTWLLRRGGWVVAAQWIFSFFSITVRLPCFGSSLMYADHQWRHHIGVTSVDMRIQDMERWGWSLGRSWIRGYRIWGNGVFVYKNGTRLPEVMSYPSFSISCIITRVQISD